jgi:YHS domain-containing protein
MIAAFIREFVFPLLIFLLLRSLLVSLFSRRRRPPTRAAAPPTTPPAVPGGTLHKDPVCGTYVSGDSALTLKINGEMLYFCSRECLDKYHGVRK